MSRHLNDYDIQALRESHDLGFHPHPWPMGDGHHTDASMLVVDKTTGDALAYFMGDLFSDLSVEKMYEMSSADQWSRVARALRITGLAIIDLEKKP